MFGYHNIHNNIILLLMLCVVTEALYTDELLNNIEI